MNRSVQRRPISTTHPGIDKGRAELCVLTLLLATGCQGPPTPDITVDLRTPCEAFTQLTLSSDLTPGMRTLQLAGDVHRQPAGWAVTVEGSSYALRRIGDTRLDAPPPVALSPFSSQGQLTLHAGPAVGETWLVRDEPSEFSLWQLHPDGVVKQSGNLGAEFVGSSFRRDLIFIGDTPYVIGIPTSSDTTEYEVWVGELDNDLNVGTTWSLELTGTCPDETFDCASKGFADIALLDQAEADGTSPALLLLSFDQVLDSTRSIYIATLRVDFDDDSQRPIALRREYFPRQVWPVGGSLQAYIAPAQIARDTDGYYILAGLHQINVDDPSDQLDSVLVRFDSLSGIANAPYIGFPQYVSPHLLQLDTRVALGQYGEGSWHIAPLVSGNNANFVIDLDNLSSLALGESSELVEVKPGGRSQVLHRTADNREIHTLITCGDPVSAAAAPVNPTATENMMLQVPPREVYGELALPPR